MNTMNIMERAEQSAAPSGDVHPVHHGSGLTFAAGAKQAAAVLAKDLRAELRNRAALNSVLLFTVTSLVVVGFAVGSGQVAPALKAALLWVVLFFAAFSGLAHVFTHEEEANTALALRLTAAPGAVYAGKLAFNLLLLFGIGTVAVPLFAIILDLKVGHPLAFVGVLVCGGMGLAAAATIVAAIIAKARGKGALYGALGFPILLPLMFIAVDGTRAALAGEAAGSLGRDMVGLLAYAIMLVAASSLLFPFVWEE